MPGKFGTTSKKKPPTREPEDEIEDEIEEDEIEGEDEDEEPPRKSSKKAPSKPSKAGKPSKQKPRKRRNKYADATPEAPRDPMPPKGEYVFKIGAIEQSTNDGNGNQSVKVPVTVAEVIDGGEDVSEGDEFCVLFTSSSKSAQYAVQRVFAFVIAASGFETLEDYLEVDPERDFLPVIIDGDTDGPMGEQSLEGRYVRSIVTLGKEVLKDGEPTGDHYRNYKWFPVDEEHQEAPQLQAAE